ncbi:MAG: hypothetical protein KatS3mg077_3255 [Candidatus Binatia bacterium]|nr:MAG: hypothetical protein KatS3mg077_3255 [Candidatus Binatia bacterium]
MHFGSELLVATLAGESFRCCLLRRVYGGGETGEPADRASAPMEEIAALPGGVQNGPVLLEFR